MPYNSAFDRLAFDKSASGGHASGRVSTNKKPALFTVERGVSLLSQSLPADPLAVVHTGACVVESALRHDWITLTIRGLIVNRNNGVSRQPLAVSGHLCLTKTGRNNRINRTDFVLFATKFEAA